MKKSEQISQEAHQEDNDFRFMKKMNDAMRQERLENFEDKWLKKFEASPEIKQVTAVLSMGKWVLVDNDGYFYDYYPKANKVLIRHKNKWQKPGLKWLVKTFIKK